MYSLSKFKKTKRKQQKTHNKLHVCEPLILFEPFNVLRTYCIIVSGRCCVFIYININMQQLKKCQF